MRFMVSGVAVAAVLAATAVSAQDIKLESVRAHEAFLASDALRGRGSATPDEGVAAAYVASEFESYGLKTAPGMDGYLQTAAVVTPHLSGHASLAVGQGKTAEGAGLTLIYSAGAPISGSLTVASDPDPKNLPVGDILLIANPGTTPALNWWRAARGKNAKLVILRESDDTKKVYDRFGDTTGSAPSLEEAPPAMGGGKRPDLATLPPAAFDAAAKLAGEQVTLDLGGGTLDKSVTTNAIGYLPGSDPNAGIILITAHLDHLGVRPDGTIMHGANDDASGTTAVLEIAQAMASGPQPKRGILFVAYGSEELGGLGSQYFGMHPPIPLDQIVTNLEFEMIGAHDPKMDPGVMMMTGFDRSNLGETLKAQGALVAPDIYPDQHFFERSDNYSLALKGIVAHTISGWAVTPTYHDPSDTIANLDLDFMTKAIQSLIVPVKYLANSDFKPDWKPGGKPMP